MVEHPLYDVAAVAVEGRNVLQKLEGIREVLRYLLEGNVVLFDLMVDGRQLFGDTLLLGFQKLQRDRVVVVGFEELFAFMLQLPSSAEKAVYFQIVLFLFSRNHALELFFDGDADLRRQLDLIVELLDFPLDFPDQDIARLAVVAFTVPAGADEVRVHRPILLLRVADEHSLAAKGAVDGALKKMRMFVAAFSVDVRFQNGLRLFPCDVVYQGFVCTGVFNPFVGNDAFVVGVGEYLAQRLKRDGLRWHPCSGAGAQPAGCKVFCEALDRPFT